MYQMFEIPPNRHKHTHTHRHANTKIYTNTCIGIMRKYKSNFHVSHDSNTCWILWNEHGCDSKVIQFLFLLGNKGVYTIKGATIRANIRLTTITSKLSKSFTLCLAIQCPSSRLPSSNVSFDSKSRCVLCIYRIVYFERHHWNSNAKTRGDLRTVSSALTEWSFR